MVAAIGVTAMNLLKGPVRAMAQITKRTVAENAMIANGKLTLIMSAQTPGDWGISCIATALISAPPVDRQICRGRR